MSKRGKNAVPHREDYKLFMGLYTMTLDIVVPMGHPTFVEGRSGGATQIGLLTHMQAGLDLDVWVGGLDNIFRNFLWKRITDIAMIFLRVRSDHILREKCPRD